MSFTECGAIHQIVTIEYLVFPSNHSPVDHFGNGCNKFRERRKLDKRSERAFEREAEAEGPTSCHKCGGGLLCVAFFFSLGASLSPKTI